MALTVVDARDPVWADAGHSAVNVSVRFSDENGDVFGGAYLPFTASPDDVEAHGRAVWEGCLKGAFGEIAEYVAPVVPFDVQKAGKLQELARWFDWASANAHVMSSLGFEIDADAVANRNIEGLITAVEGGLLAEPVSFMDYNNQVHPVGLSGLKTMLLEVIANGQALYQQKWAFRERIVAAQTEAELDAIVLPAIDGGDAA